MLEEDWMRMQTELIALKEVPTTPPLHQDEASRYQNPAA